MRVLLLLFDLLVSMTSNIKLRYGLYSHLARNFTELQCNRLTVSTALHKVGSLSNRHFILLSTSSSYSWTLSAQGHPAILLSEAAHPGYLQFVSARPNSCRTIATHHYSRELCSMHDLSVHFRGGQNWLPAAYATSEYAYPEAEEPDEDEDDEDRLLQLDDLDVLDLLAEPLGHQSKLPAEVSCRYHNTSATRRPPYHCLSASYTVCWYCRMCC